MEITNEKVKLLIDSLEDAGCENARFLVTHFALPRVNKKNHTLESVIRSFRSEGENTFKYKLYSYYRIC